MKKNLARLKRIDEMLERIEKERIRLTEEWINIAEYLEQQEYIYMDVEDDKS